LKLCRTRLNSEVIYSGKDSNSRKDTRQKEGKGQTKTIWREKCFDKIVCNIYRPPKS